MSEHTPITGELRDTLERAECVFTNSAGFEQVNVTKVALDSMLDAIDAIHANLERENARLKAKLEEDTKDWLSFDGEIARLRERTERLKAECDEAEHRGWTRGYDEGFADADDVLGVFEEYGVLDEHGWVKLPKDADGVTIHAGDVLDGYGKTIEVVELRHGRSGWVIISRDGNAYADTYAFSHRQPDSWERIIEDAWNGRDSGKNLVARCKALAGDAE